MRISWCATLIVWSDAPWTATSRATSSLGWEIASFYRPLLFDPSLWKINVENVKRKNILLNRYVGTGSQFVVAVALLFYRTKTAITYFFYWCFRFSRKQCFGSGFGFYGSGSWIFFPIRIRATTKIIFKAQTKFWEKFLFSTQKVGILFLFSTHQVGTVFY